MTESDYLGKEQVGVGLKSPKMAIFAKINFWGLKYPPEVLVELKTCSAICGTHVHTILNHKDLTGSTVGVREGQNMAKNCLILPLIASFDRNPR